MATNLGQGLRRLGYRRARALLLVLGLLVLLLVAVVTYVRRVETVEVTATLLFMPVFVAAVLWGVWGGTIAGLGAAVAYAILRLPAVDAVGAGPFLGLFASRGVAFVLFGAIGGWAATQITRSIKKLEQHDQVDDLTGLLNARFLLHETDVELARSKRYQTVFSLASVEIPADAVEATSRRGLRRLRELARELRESVRTVDRATHVLLDDRHLVAVILPETGPEGAQVFTNRLADRVARHFGSSEQPLPRERFHARSWTFPGDEEEFRAFRDEIRRSALRDYEEDDLAVYGGEEPATA